MLGYDEEEILQLGPLQLTHEDDQPIAAELLAEILSGRLQSYQIEKRLRRKDGAFIWVSVYCSRVPGTDMVSDFYQAVVIDISERKRAEAEARESERRYREVQTELAHSNRVATMGQLAASIAHEMNQPITAILTNAHVGQRWLTSPSPVVDEVRQALGRIVSDSTRAADVMGRIRDLIKKTATRKDRLDVNAAIAEVIELTRAEMVKNGVSLTTQFAEDLPPVEGDRVELQQVMLNLIVNAVEAMSETTDGKRELLITTDEREPQGILVAVRDSGPGLAAEDRERAFDSFYTTKPRGMGMGLSICRSIIEAHGGRLWASANTPRGAVFQFTLPAQPDAGVTDALERRTPSIARETSG
jgi:PAS domain S-box-containing protein